MNVTGVNQFSNYQTTNAVKTASKDTAAQSNDTQKSTQAATYTKSEEKVTGKKDTAVIERLKAEAEEKTAQLRSLVEKMMKKQGLAFTDATDMYALLREGKLKVDAETANQAAKDISEDGYWGVEQTSERLVSFAKALAGNDPKKADEMIAAVEKGFKLATKAWGDELPEICKQTLEVTKQKLTDWKNTLSSEK